MLLSQIQGENKYVKDLETGAILNTDVTEIEKSKARKKKMREEKEEIQILKSEVADIKTLLLEIHRKLGD
tara:strand:+ start:4760 stop:4969 length:210 start_codon:yes stop_codon:yes gene_type:complete